MENLYPQVLRLKVNRGGAIDEEEVIGRARELDTLLRTLERQSVLVAAERRIGKTTLCKQAQRRLSGASLALYHDIEPVSSTVELASVLVRMASPHLSLTNRWKHRSSALYRRLAGTEISLPDTIGGGGFTLPPALHRQWKELIEDTIADLLAAHTEGKNRKQYVYLFLDEFPIALDNIYVKEGSRTAMEVLDLFRSLREMHGSTLRFVFTGSIGIHHIVSRLRKEGYKNDPLNNVFTLHVKALGHDDARTLALGLLLGEEISSLDYDAVAGRIADGACCVPFYIHHIVGALSDENLKATDQSVDKTIEDSITDPLDPWKLRNYKTRLEQYFPDTRPIALALLDVLAVMATPCDFDTLCNLVRLKIVDSEDETIGNTLDLLEQDFYIERDSQQHTYRFLRPLLAHAWRHIQRLKDPQIHV